MTMAFSAPSDETGAYPALAGYTAMTTQRRFLVALADAGLMLAVCAIAAVAVLVLGRESLVAGAVALLVIVALLAAELWALFGRSSRLAGVLMKARYVDVLTGRPSGGKLFGKQLLQGLLAAVTIGIAPLVIVLTTVKEPLKRNWFDRTLGLMLVDERSGRPVGSAVDPVAAPVEPRLGGVSHVQFPAAASAPAPTAWPSHPAVSAEPAPAAPLAVRPVVEDGGLITSTPFSAAARPTEPESPAAEAPAAEAPSLPPVVVREMRSVDASVADATVLAHDVVLERASVAPQSHAVLDDGRRLSLTPPSVLGRNPVAPGSHPDALPCVVEDQLASKTHLLVGSDANGVWVIDLQSTNGVTVSKAAGAEPVKVTPGRRVRVASGGAIAFGDRSIAVL